MLRADNKLEILNFSREDLEYKTREFQKMFMGKYT